ncbi:MAG: two-component regulator propeller domain-containing protein [Woeseiaceae bacterium]|nr:two-component regulator propeller domain-containing protein [Woeseiaceae bacterium]
MMRSIRSKKNRRSLGLIIAVLSSLLATGSAALAAADKSHPMRFGHLSINDGLSQSNVLAVLQDSDGFMWFATENGLNSYDGYEFRHFKRERGNPEALSNDFIFDIAEGRDGSLWLATNGGGLANLDRNSGVVRNFRHNADDAGSIGSNVLKRLHVDNNGVVWIGTRGAGLDRFDPAAGEFVRVDLGDVDTSGTVHDIQSAGDSALWVAGDHGLVRIDTETGAVTNFDAALGALAEHGVRAILEDSDGQLWIGTYGGGIARFDAETRTFDRYGHDANDPATLSDDRVSVLFEDDANRLWAGTAGGLNLVNRETGAVVRYMSDNEDVSSLSDNDISSIFQDRSGLLWIGTKSHGVNKWNPSSWLYGYEPAKNVPEARNREPNVMAFIDDGEGTLWLGTFGDGLNAIDRESGDVVRYRADATGPLRIAGDRVMSLMRDRDGRIWAGTMMNGITRIDPATGNATDFRHRDGDTNSLSANGIMTMYEDRGGLVWIGTFGGGISLYDPADNSFTHYKPDSDDPYSVSSARITSISEDASGDLWIGTDAGGLNLFDRETERFHRFAHDPEDVTTLAADTVYSVNVDADGVVWVGTQGGGLDRVVGDSSDPASVAFTNVSEKDGLANDVVYGVQFDDSGRVWVSTNYGISRYNPETGEIKNLHRTDGLQSEEFNFGAHYRSESGELFFGGHNGFNSFRPEKIQGSTVVPLVALTGFFRGGDSARTDLPIGDTDAVELSWKDDRVTFEFAAMDFAAPEQNRYMYKLEGFDEEWIDLGNRRRATYTDLDDGNYLLRVKAANSDGIWSEADFALPVKVAAAPWNTWWAYLGYAALFVHLVAGLWLGHRRKIHREEEYSRRLENEVNARTEALLDRNKQLSVLNKALQESSLSDPLTGLRNRRFVFEEVSRDFDLVKRRIDNERLGIDTSDMSELVFMMIDLDNFKPINDTYGHAAGDEMLLQLRDVLLGICRRSDFVIRWGGDEFVVISKQTQSDEAEHLAERIRSSIAGSNFKLSDGQIVRTTCSIGFAAYPLFRNSADESSLDQIISLADSLMYEAKKRRNAWVGMMGPNDVIASFEPEDDSIESTSLLFRARGAGNVRTFSRDNIEQEVPLRILNAG